MRAIGVDVGTMFFQTAENDVNGDIKTQIIRNAFVELAKNEDTDEILKNNKWQYVDDGKAVYILGEDSLKVAKMLPGKVELRRPLADGVLNAGEEKKHLVLAELVKSSIGRAPDKNSVVVTCVSSDPVDGSGNNTFHEARLKGIFSSQGWNVKVIEEGMAVIYAENPKIEEEDGTTSPFSGIGISFGAGRVNCVLAHKGIKILGMSASRSGDWIDKQVAQQTGVPIAQITSYKERKLDFNNLDTENDVAFALDAYYRAMIEYVFNMFAKRLQKDKPAIDRPLDIVIAGGTSMPKGFVNVVREVIANLDLPFEVNEVRHSTDPRNAVVKGLLINAEVHARKLSKSNAAAKVEEKVEEPKRSKKQEKPSNDLLDDLL